MPVTLRRSYRRDGYVTAHLLDPIDVAALREDIEALHRRAAHLIVSSGDFTLEADQGTLNGRRDSGLLSMPGVLQRVSNVVAHSRVAAIIAARADLHGLAADLTRSRHVELTHSIV